jgi:hypothetical protein
MHSVGKLLNWFHKLRLHGWQIGGDEGGMGHVIMDRMAEQDFHLHRVNNGSPAKRSDIFTNLSAEWWSTVGQLIERKMIRLPSGDEKLIAQLTSRRKLYDSRGREKLERVLTIPGVMMAVGGRTRPFWHIPALGDPPFCGPVWN